MPRPIYALIDTDAMARNLRSIRLSAPGKPVWAVVKANAYGHGIERAIGGLQESDGLAMLDFAEAARCRSAGWSKPILMLEGAFDDSDLRQASHQSLSLVVHDEASLKSLELLATSVGVNFQLPAVWLKLNSGMNRLGFSLEAWSDALRRAVVLQNSKHIRSIGIMSHFARADDAAGIGAAMKLWEIAESQARALIPVQTCLANSAAILRYHGVDADWVRCGISLYGATPFSWASQTEGASQARTLTPTMGLYAQVIAVQDVRAGDQVGYGGSFVATKAMRVGVVACGYADGYPRSARSGTPVLVQGIRCPTVGRVSMDMLTVDLSNAPSAKVGSPAELWGRRLSIDEVAEHAQTIGYELMCALAARVPTRLGALHGEG